MNYSHDYHAGNHSELFKHSVLAALVMQLRMKAAPFAVLDTHAGFGKYDLTSRRAIKTGEAARGIGKIFRARDLSAVAPYLDAVHALNPETLRVYPGSSLIVRRLLRERDRLVACELHDEPFGSLKMLFSRDSQVSVHQRDGYEVAMALVPPHERRGLVFIDPPYESKDESTDAVHAALRALEKWPTGIYAVWYPIKTKSGRRSVVDGFRGASVKKLLIAEFIPYPEEEDRLAGSGMAICNAPWKFEETVAKIGAELMGALGAKGSCKIEVAE